ncbi:MAG: protein-glutamate O-methyltransferase CheR [Calditrichaeota bacterium]|nr:MAG: protein-glutamate O-methyltransferase CheR [Calditrichota bacterium]
MHKTIKNIDIEIKLLIDAIFHKYGYDLREFLPELLQDKFQARLKNSNFKSFSEMQHKILYDKDFFEIVLADLTSHPSNNFPNPIFYQNFKKIVNPILKEKTFFKIWFVGCSTGENVYTFSILLAEEDLLKRSQIYATDFNDLVLSKAREGIYSLEIINEFEDFYRLSGGKEKFSKYYTVLNNSAVIKHSLRNIVFADHNLTTDGVFSETDLIVCLNILQNFNEDLRERAISVFQESLNPNGILCLEPGSDYKNFVKELKMSELKKGTNIFQKK